MMFNIRGVCLVMVLALAVRSVGVESAVSFSLPGSTLLFAGDWNVVVVTRETTEVILLPAGPEGHNGPSAVPTLSANGELIASGFPVANDNNKRWRVSCAVAVYSRATKRWRTYGNFSQVYVGSFSPDASKVAFLADDGPTNSRRLLLLRLDTGQISELSSVGADWVSWSPDGQKLALGTPGGGTAPHVQIFDLFTQSITELASGSLPAWSPSGTWIAYLGSDQTIRLVHPDGTGDHFVKQVTEHWFSREKSFGFAPVWSPDETKLLLNYYKGTNLRARDVVLLDLATGKMITKLHNGDAIFAWVSSQK